MPVWVSSIFGCRSSVILVVRHSPMFRQYLKIIGFLFRIGVMLWFVAMLVLPVYGWLSPWPEAERTLDAEGLKGTKFMIGVGSSSEGENDTWSNERQRSYIVLPASLRSLE